MLQILGKVWSSCGRNVIDLLVAKDSVEKLSIWLICWTLLLLLLLLQTPHCRICRPAFNEEIIDWTMLEQSWNNPRVENFTFCGFYDFPVQAEQCREGKSPLWHSTGQCYVAWWLVNLVSVYFLVPSSQKTFNILNLSGSSPPRPQSHYTNTECVTEWTMTVRLSS